uniref:Uncharacterized protein n=1 Tax=Arundo donax TaxID=35708 RepID=A0A0A9ADA6_ARUDO
MVSSQLYHTVSGFLIHIA